MISRMIAVALFTVSTMLVAIAPANAATYTLNCTDAHSGAAVTVDVSANSRSEAVQKTKDDPAYSDYENCS